MTETWQVDVAYEDDDPGIYGPYTERQAERVAARLSAEVALSTDKYGHNHHPRGVRSANAMPMARYDAFLTAEEKRGARVGVRVANKRKETD